MKSQTVFGRSVLEVVWDHLNSSRIIWAHLGASGNIWTNLGSSESIWDHLESSGIISETIRDHQGSSGLIWRHPKSSGETLGGIWELSGKSLGCTIWDHLRSLGVTRDHLGRHWGVSRKSLGSLWGLWGALAALATPGPPEGSLKQLLQYSLGTNCPYKMFQVMCGISDVNMYFAKRKMEVAGIYVSTRTLSNTSRKLQNCR